jgi:ATP-dependent exoDNAse (exonuclease V) beta subunit
VRLRSFCAWFAAERRAAPRHALDELIERAVTTRGYDLHTLRLPDGARRMANVRKLLRLAREFEAQEGRDVRAFIDWVWLADELGTREGEAPIDSEDMEAVRLMTIHAAKGLEFDTVCVADLGRPPRGDLPDLLVDGGEVGLRLASLDGEKGTKALAYEKLSKRRAEADFEEERRIFYVAMTRARERLIISGAIAIDGWPSGPGAPALSWIGPAVAPGIDTLLSTERPLAEIERDFDGRRAAVVCSLNSPVTVGDVLRVEPVPAEPGAAPADNLEETPPEAFAATAPARRPPVRALSYSGLEGYARCGYRFYAERVLRLPATDRTAAEEPAERLDALSRGTLAHALLERVDLGAPTLPSGAEVAEAARARGMTLSDGDAEDLLGMVGAFAASDLRKRLAAAGPVRREAPFAFELAGGAGESVLINGVVDAIARGGDDALVVDYKSDRLGAESPANRADRDYATQRLVYALAALRDGAAAVEVVHCFLERPEDLAVARFTAAEVPELEQRLSRLAAGVLASHFEVSPLPHRRLCQFCPARGSLCSWDVELTMREEPEPQPERVA